MLVVQNQKKSEINQTIYPCFISVVFLSFLLHFSLALFRDHHFSQYTSVLNGSRHATHGLGKYGQTIFTLAMAELSSAAINPTNLEDLWNVFHFRCPFTPLQP